MANRLSDEKSRSDKLRAHRNQSRKTSQTKPFVSNATRKQSNRTVPVTRRHTSPPPVTSRKRNTVNVPLKSKGAELQLPAFPKIQLGWRLISGLIAVLSLIAVFSFSSAGTFKISTITLEGSHRLSSEAILSMVDLIGTNIIRVKPDEIETEIAESFPSLRSVQVITGLPASVTVCVVERQPVIEWQQDNIALWIDDEGVLFPIRGEADVQLTVMASDPPPAAVSDDQKIDNLTEANEFVLETQALPRTTAAFVEGILSLVGYIPEGTNLQYDPQFGLGWQDPQGWMVYFGRDTSNIDIKLAEYQSIISALQAENLYPALISLEFLHAPFYRLEQ